jgi:hypothetical protein
MKLMVTAGLIGATVIGVAVLVAVGRAGIGPTVKAVSGSTRAERGKYLVSVIGCNDCHTPLAMGPTGPEPDLTRFLSGHPEQMGPLPVATAQGPWLWTGAATNTAFSGPWGVSYAANLTPDQNTGLGIWTEDMFISAIRTGRHMGTSRPIAPPMPWPAFRNATDEDLKSIFTYLRTIKPLANHVPDYQPPVEAALASAR